MPIFRVFAVSEETYKTLVKAETMEEAIEKANKYYEEYCWDEVDGSLETTIRTAVLEKE